LVVLHIRSQYWSQNFLQFEAIDKQGCFPPPLQLSPIQPPDLMPSWGQITQVKTENKPPLY
jgi:hypothetical protein